MPLVYNPSSVSPTTTISFGEDVYFQRSERVITVDKSVIEQLSEYKFPKLPSLSTNITDQGKKSSPTSPKTNNSYQTSPSPLFHERRKSFHRRSTPVSLSSAESIFDSFNISMGSPMSVEIDEFSISSKKDLASYNNRLNSKKSVELMKQPVIDLGLALRPFRPRTGSGILEFEHLGSDKLKITEETDETDNDDDDDDEEIENNDDENNGNGLEEEISLLDFLKESKNDITANIEEDYDPLKQIMFSPLLWVFEDNRLS